MEERRGTNEREGTVEEELPRGLWSIRLDSGVTVTASMSTSAKRVTVKLIRGDRVRVAVSTVDPRRGRITARL